MALRFDQVRQVGVNVRPGDAGGCVISALGLAEDADEVGDPLLVSLPGQQRHDHQLDAQEHDEVAPLGMNADHGDGRHAAPRAEAKIQRGDCQLWPVRFRNIRPASPLSKVQKCSHLRRSEE